MRSIYPLPKSRDGFRITLLVVMICLGVALGHSRGMAATGDPLSRTEVEAELVGKTLRLEQRGKDFTAVLMPDGRLVMRGPGASGFGHWAFDGDRVCRMLEPAATPGPDAECTGVFRSADGYLTEGGIKIRPATG